VKLKWLCLIIYAGLNLSLLYQKIYAEADYVLGGKISTSVMEGKLAVNKEKYNFGISCFSDKITPTIPVSIKAGNLSAGGMLSKMNNPLLSGPGSPFSTGVSTVSGITASLPGISSYSKPVSSFFQAGYSNRKSLFPKVLVNCWYSPSDSKLAFSGYSETSLFNKKLKLKNAFATGTFPYEEKDSNSWNLSTPYYPEGTHLVSTYSGSFEFWKAYFYFSTACFESPFGTLSETFRSDFKYSGSHFTFSFSGAYNPNDSILSASDQTVKESLQFRTALQYKDRFFIQKPFFYKAGTYLYLNRNIPSEEQSLKLGTGIQTQYDITSLSLAAHIKANLNAENLESPVLLYDGCSFNLTNTWYFKPITASLSSNVSFNPSSDFSYTTTKLSTNLALDFCRNPKIHSTSTYSISFKEQEITKQSLYWGFSMDIKFYILTGSIKIALDVDY